MEYTAKYARPLRPQNLESQPRACSKEAERADEKSYRRSHSCINCERQRNANGVRQEPERSSGSEVDAKAGPFSLARTQQKKALSSSTDQSAISDSIPEISEAMMV